MLQLNIGFHYVTYLNGITHVAMELFVVVEFKCQFKFHYSRQVVFIIYI
jgi:hypothetical protein